MANLTAPNGFVPMGIAGGISPNYALENTANILIAKNDATKCFRGDPLKKLSTGYLTQWTAGTSAALLAGVFWGCKYYSISQNRIIWSKYWPGSDAASDVQIEMIPIMGAVAQRFHVQSSAAAITFGNINNNIDVVLGTGNTLNQMSGASVDQTTINTTATLPFKIVDLYSAFTPGVNGSDNTTSFNRVVVQANIAVTVGI